jgi:hypothetical protein
MLIPTYMEAFAQGCQIFLDTTYQNGKNIPKYHKYIPKYHKNIPKYHKNIPKYHKNIPKYHKNIPNVRKIYKMCIKYTNIFACKTLQNLPKLFLV